MTIWKQLSAQRKLLPSIRDLLTVLDSSDDPFPQNVFSDISVLSAFNTRLSDFVALSLAPNPLPPTRSVCLSGFLIVSCVYSHGYKRTRARFTPQLTDRHVSNTYMRARVAPVRNIREKTHTEKERREEESGWGQRK